MKLPRARHRPVQRSQGKSIAGNSGRYHQGGRLWAKDSTMRLDVWPKKIALRYSSPPAMPAGTAQASAIAAPHSTASRMPPYQRPQRRCRVHHGASSATGKTSRRITGPLVSTPRPIATLRQAKPRRLLPSAASSVPYMPSRAKKATMMSNIAAVEKKVHSRQEQRIRTAGPAMSLRPGHRRRASPIVSSRLAAETNGATRRGHHSLTPKAAQPAWNSQIISGGL